MHSSTHLHEGNSLISGADLGRTVICLVITSPHEPNVNRSHDGAGFSSHFAPVQSVLQMHSCPSLEDGYPCTHRSLSGLSTGYSFTTATSSFISRGGGEGRGGEGEGEGEGEEEETKTEQPQHSSRGERRATSPSLFPFLDNEAIALDDDDDDVRDVDADPCHLLFFPLLRRRGGAPPLFPDGFLRPVAPLSLFFLSSFGRVDFPHLHLRSPSPREVQTCLLDHLLLLLLLLEHPSRRRRRRRRLYEDSSRSG